MSKLSLVIFVVIFVWFSSCLYCQNDVFISNLVSQLEETDNDTSRVNILLKLCEEQKKGNVQKAKIYGNKALTLSTELKLTNQVAKACYLIAEIHFNLYEYDSVHIRVQQARELLNEKNTNLELWARLNHVESAVYTTTGRYNEAFELLRESVGIFNLLDDIGGLANAYNRLGILFESKSVYDSAIYYYYKSNKYYSQSADSLGIAKTLINLGISYTNIGEFNKALQHNLQAEKIFLNVKKQKSEAMNYNGIGKLYVILKQYDSAFIYFGKSLNLYDSIGLLNSLGSYVYMNRGAAYEELKEYQKAFADYTKAHQLAIEINDQAKIIDAKKNIALIYERWGDYKKALEIYDTCLMLAKKYEYNSSIVHTYFNIFRTWELVGDYKKAYEYQEVYNYWKDSIFSLEKAEIIANLEVKYETEKKQAKILSLQNETLKKDIDIRKKRNELTIAVLAGIGGVLITLLLLFLFLLKAKKNRIIKEKEIQRLREEKKALAAKSLLVGQEEERKRVAMELHDGIGVLLSTVKMQFTNYIDKNPENTKMLAKATSVLDEASKDVRRISRNMMPGILSKLGLNEAIEDLFEELNETTDINAECLVEGSTTRLPENVEIMIFRVIQEIVNNVLKHAKASQVSMVFNRLENEIRIQFSDNGKGFNIKEARAKKSMGIQSIESRVNFLGGELNIESDKEKGTSYFIVIPQLNAIN